MVLGGNKLESNKKEVIDLFVMRVLRLNHCTKCADIV